MDIYYQISMFAVMAGAGPVMLKVLELILGLAFDVRVVDDTGAVAAVDGAMASSAWFISKRRAGVSGLPADGFALFLGGFGFRSTENDGQSGPTSTWTLYLWNRTATPAVAKAAQLDARPCVMVSQFETAGPWHSATHKDPQPARLAACVPNEWQSAALEEIVGSWRKNGRASAYVHGEPGTGKSFLAALVANRICKESGSQVVLVRGADLTAKGVLVGTFLELSEVRARPHVLVLDEFNTAVSSAEDSPEGMSDARCLAANKTSLLATLDWLAEIPNLVVIATGNVPPGVPTTHQPYYRPGRFDIHVESE